MQPNDSGREPARRPPRADARRNIEAILAAAERCLARNPEATVAEIAREAGVGRVTLYGHFPTRKDLVDAVFQRVVGQADSLLGTVDTSTDPMAALADLVSSSWEVVHRYRAVLDAAERELPEERIRDHHDPHLERLTKLIDRGRATGAFRTDLPTEWLVTVCYTLMHAAAGEVSAGRLTADAAETAIVRTTASAYAPPS